MDMDDTDNDAQCERGMPRNQYGIVDGCFEEGQYEAGIAVLNDLRDPKYNPPHSQIRQLLYLALYPPGRTIPDNLLTARGFEPASPNKFGTAKQQRAENYPTLAASEAARRLLASLTITNTPESLFSALPSYTSPRNGQRDLVDLDDEDSYLGRASVCIKESRNCWMMLRGGFIQPRGANTATPKGSEKQSHRDTIEDLQSFSKKDTIPSSTIADHAWPVLGWFLTVFERDEIRSEERGMPRHSPLLLSQISNAAGRWDLDAPLDIMMCSLEQADERRRSLGLKLFSLLVHLTSTIHFNTPMFLASVYSRLLTLTSDPLFDLLGSMSSCATGQTFKVALCRKYLTEALGIHDGYSGGRRPIPLARPVALPTSQSSCGNSPRQTAASASISGKNSLPGSAEVIRLLENSTMCVKTSLHSIPELYRIKFEFLITYGTLQSQLPSDQKDEGWRTMLAEGSLKPIVDTSFGMEMEGRVFREAIMSILVFW